MAWGLWNKIKNGFKKVGGFIKDKVLKPVVNTVIKPFKPVISSVASAINPALGAAVNKGMTAVEKFSDEGWGNTGLNGLITFSVTVLAADLITLPAFLKPFLILFQRPQAIFSSGKKIAIA